MLLHTLQCSAVTCLHQASLYIGKAFVQGTVNSAGTDVIAAYTAATRIEGFANSFGDSGSSATSIIISQNHASGNNQRVKKTFQCSITYTLLLGICCAIVLYLTAPATIFLLTGQFSGITFNDAVRYLRLIAFFYPFCFTGGSFTGYYNGLTKVLLTLIGSLGQITLRVILSWYWFHTMQLNAVALATGIGWICANIFWFICKLYLRHTTGKK